MLQLPVTLYKHQQRILDLNPDKFLLAHGTGSGKTITSLALAKKNKAVTLAVVPKPVYRKWQKAMKDMGVYGDVITRDRFRIDIKELPLNKYDAIIFDEVHSHFASLQAQSFKKALWYIEKANITYRWLLTATPYTSSYWSVYAIAKLLGYKWNYQEFRNRFFYEQWYGSKSVWLPRGDKHEEIAALVNTIGNTVSIQDCADVPEQIIDIELFTETAEQKRARKQILIDESNPLVRTTKYHQIASGVLKGNEFVDDQIFKADKNARIVEHCTNHNKVVVFSRYNQHLRLLEEMLTKADIPCAIINGAVDDKETIIEDANKATRFVLLINTACAEGYELPTFDFMIFASLSYSFVQYAQAMGRILRINHLKKNYYLIMLTETTVDEAVWLSVQRKEEFNEAIFAKTLLSEYEEKNTTRKPDADNLEALLAGPLDTRDSPF